MDGTRSLTKTLLQINPGIPQIVEKRIYGFQSGPESSKQSRKNNFIEIIKVSVILSKTYRTDSKSYKAQIFN